VRGEGVAAATVAAYLEEDTAESRRGAETENNGIGSRGGGMGVKGWVKVWVLWDMFIGWSGLGGMVGLLLIGAYLLSLVPPRDRGREREEER
jgi:hypothetical protein